MTSQLNIEYAKKARDKGIEKAVKHADQVNDRWSDRAYGLFKDFIKANAAPFQAEDFRHSITGLIELPPSNRAFGGIVRRAAYEGLIRRVGTAPVSNVAAHSCFATVWQKT